MAILLATPSTSHLSFDNVYEPAEDSFLLLDTIGSATETAFLQKKFPAFQTAPLVVEIGPGSGVVLAFVNAHARKIFNHNHIMTMAVDINRKACVATPSTVTRATSDLSSPSGSQYSTATFLDAVQGDLGLQLRDGSVDMVIFNPPYVPTEESPAEIMNQVANDAEEQSTRSARFEADSRLLALSYAGGLDGMETTNRFLEQLPQILNPQRGVAYLLLCAGNKPLAVIDLIKGWGHDWNVLVCGHSGKQGGRETLQILRIWRTCHSND